MNGVFREDRAASSGFDIPTLRSKAGATVGFFAKSRDKFRLRSALKRLKKSPSPQALCELVQCHVKLSELDAAHEYTTWGLKRFPGSALVQEMHRIVVRERAYVGMNEVREEVRKDPTPEGYLKLARFSLQARDGTAAISALEECVRRFPTSVPAIHALADMKERRYLRDLSSADGRAVVKLLSDAWTLDGRNLEWQMKLARFYQKLDALHLARQAAEHARQRKPKSRTVREFLSYLPEAPADQEDDLERILREIEERGYLPGFGEEAIRVQMELDRLRKGLNKTQKKIGATRALVLVRDGEAYNARGMVASDAFVRLSNNLLRSTHRTCRRSGLGPLRGATLETDGGSVLIRRGYRATVACMTPTDSSIKGSQEELGQFLAGVEGQKAK